MHLIFFKASCKWFCFYYFIKENWNMIDKALCQDTFSFLFKSTAFQFMDRIYFTYYEA